MLVRPGKMVGMLGALAKGAIEQPIITTGHFQGYSKPGSPFSAFLGMFGFSLSDYGVAYTDKLTAYPSTFPKGALIEWNLTAGNHESGVLIEFWATGSPHASGDISGDIKAEIGIFGSAPAHIVNFFNGVVQRGTFVASDGVTYKIAENPGAVPYYMLMRSDNGDINATTFPWEDYLNRLIRLGLVNPDWYFNGMGAGVEPYRPFEILGFLHVDKGNYSWSNVQAPLVPARLYEISRLGVVLDWVMLAVNRMRWNNFDLDYVAGPRVPWNITDLSATIASATSLQLAFTNAPGATSHQYRVNGGAPQTLAGSKAVTGLPEGVPASVEVRGVNATGPATSWSNVATKTPGSVPIVSAAPVISAANLAVGTTWSCTAGTWSGSPTGYAYQWKRDGANIPGATASTYVAVNADKGAKLTCSVTPTNAVGSGAPATSNASGYIGNMWVSPDDLTNAAWIKTGVTISGAKTMVETTLNGEHKVAQTIAVLASNPTYRVKFRMKPVGRTWLRFWAQDAGFSGGQAINFNGAGPGGVGNFYGFGGPTIVGTPTILAVGGGVYECSFDHKPGTGGTWRAFIAMAEADDDGSYAGVVTNSNEITELRMWEL